MSQPSVLTASSAKLYAENTLWRNYIKGIWQCEHDWPDI